MTNHPNRRRGRPALPPEQRRARVSMRLAPEIVAAIDALGDGKHNQVEAILRAALLPAEA